MEKNPLRKTWPLILIVIITAISLFWLFSGRNDDNGSVEARLGDCRLQLEIAASERSQYRGLSDRDSLCQDCGLLFIFDNQAKRNFVMRDMRFPLDIVYLRDGKVTEILSDLQPEGSNRLTDHISQEDIDMALEINAGQADACRIATSSSIYFTTKYYGQTD